MTQRRILVCSYAPPQFDRDSGSRRLSQFMELLIEAGWSVTFLSYLRGEDRYADALRRRGVLVADLSYDDHEDLISAGEFDVALLAYWPVAEHFLPLVRRASPATRVIVDTIDFHFLRDARHRFSSVGDGGGPGLLDAEHGEEAVAELNTYALADLILTVSQSEAALLDSFLESTTPIRAVPLGEEVGAAASPEDRRGILFVGSFRHAPNLDAVTHLCRDIVPHLDFGLLVDHPVYVVGDALNDGVREQAADLPAVRMVGWVPDLTPYFDRCRVAVIPLRYGAGTKGKTVQSLLAGLPVVTTTIGAEGLDLENGNHAFVEDAPDAFAGAVTRLLTDDDVWRRLSTQGQAYAAARHGRKAVGDQLLASVELALRQEPKTRGWEPDRDRLDRRARRQWADRVLGALEPLLKAHLPPDPHLLVVNGTSTRTLRIPGAVIERFPESVHNGSAAGSDDPQRDVEELERRRGQNTFLVVPDSSRRWLDGHTGLRAYLDRVGRVVVDSADAGVLFDLTTGAAAAVEPQATVRCSARLPAVPAGVPAAKVIAFYLPQFHPIPENDAWWGEGFTEWVNVARAEPLFRGHYQPHAPADLGYYDLRLPQAREEQAELARQHGVHAFCYYHYWFSGKRLLERPFHEVLGSGRPDMPFVLCWANEPWSRRWNGRAQDVLQAQAYSPEDDLAHIRWLLPALGDHRAVQVDGKPMLIIYQARDLPEPAATVDRWRTEAARAGLAGLHLVTVETGWDEGWDATEAGFDAKILFQPQFSRLQTLPRLPLGPDSLRVYDYAEAVRVLSNVPSTSYPTYEAVCAGWDNTPRTGTSGWVLHGSSPELYERWLGAAVDRAGSKPVDQRVVFVNAWNEWGEGAHLEPDQRHGRAYLEATLRAVTRPVAAGLAGNGRIDPRTAVRLAGR